jgi:hypothetical protein
MSALGHKRTYAVQKGTSFTPNSDRKSGLPQLVMSALPPKADMCGATRDVRFGPKADIIGKSTLHPAKDHETTGSRIKDEGGLPISFLSM